MGAASVLILFFGFAWGADLFSTLFSPWLSLHGPQSEFSAPSESPIYLPRKPQHPIEQFPKKKN
jgi:hypothetical protein